MTRYFLGLVLASMSLMSPGVAAADPPADMRPAFDEVNRARAALGLAPYAWDDRLACSARELCERSWRCYLNGSFSNGKDGHWDLEGRLRRAGWPVEAPDGGRLVGPPGCRVSWMNYGECSGGGTLPFGSWPADGDGWCYPPQDVMAWMNETLPFLRESDGPHARDFRAGFNRVGIGHYQGFTAIDYGYLP